VDEEIQHHEILPIAKIFAKYRVYGKYAIKYASRNPKRGFKQFVIILPMYLRHWRLLAKHPLHTWGLAYLKLVQYSAGATGAIGALLGKDEPDSSENHAA
jgi:hypothetical protein